jgi:hypothetical protein
MGRDRILLIRVECSVRLCLPFLFQSHLNAISCEEPSGAEYVARVSAGWFLLWTCIVAARAQSLWLEFDFFPDEVFTLSNLGHTDHDG